MAQPPIKDNAIDNNITSGNVAGFIIGTNANNILQLDGSARIPGVDGSLILNTNDTTKVLKAGDTMTGTLKLSASGLGPAMHYIHSGAAAADEGKWRVGITGLDSFSLSSLDDTEVVSQDFMTATRSTGLTVGSVVFSPNVSVSAATPTLNEHLTRKDYVDTAIANHVGVDAASAISLTVQGVTNGTWQTVTVDANAKFAFVAGYAYGIFDAGGGQVTVYARKKGLTGVASLSWAVAEVGSQSDSSSTFSGSMLVECDVNGQIELYCYSSSSGTIAEVGEIYIKGWIT